MAIPLALVVNELLTNALKYGQSPYSVALKTQGERLVLAVGDAGQGPARDKTPTGLGSQIVEVVGKQLSATG
jgi:two-component sensor histidine kinase